MEFDSNILEIHNYIHALSLKGVKIRKYNSSTTKKMLKEKLDYFVNYAQSPSIILRDDTHVDLGDSQSGSCSIVIKTKTLPIINDGRITLVGPDIVESTRKSLPFGQIMIVGGEKIDELDYEYIYDIQYIDGWIRGYMVRSMYKNMWCRVNKDAAQKGLCFEIIGKTLIDLAKTNINEIESVEVIFITTDQSDMQLLYNIDLSIEKFLKENRKNQLKNDGYEIDCGFDCQTCVDKETCDRIREAWKDKIQKQNSDYQ